MFRFLSLIHASRLAVIPAVDMSMHYATIRDEISSLAGHIIYFSFYWTEAYFR